MDGGKLESSWGPLTGPDSGPPELDRREEVWEPWKRSDQGQGRCKHIPERWQLGGTGRVRWAWLEGRRRHIFREERWAGQTYGGAKGGDLGAAHSKAGDGGRKGADRTAGPGILRTWDIWGGDLSGRGSLGVTPKGGSGFGGGP